MISVKVTTKSTSWITDINGTFESAELFFLGKYFNVGNEYGEKMEKVTKIKIVN